MAPPDKGSKRTMIIYLIIERNESIINKPQYVASLSVNHLFLASDFGEDSGEEDLFSDSDSGEEDLFSDSDAKASHVPADLWCDMPDDLLKNIFSFLG
jgi:hypothetical protein